MALHAQGQGLEALEQEERVERADGGAQVAEQLHPGLEDVGAGAEGGPVLEAVVARVGLGELGEALGVGPEVEADPPSAMMPPIEVPWPPMNLVAEWTTMSAPCSKGRMSHGLATVLSTMSGTPTSWATSETPRMSRMSLRGLPMVSA